MNRGSRHLQYRKNIYKKRRIKIILLISVAAIVALFVLFLVVGNILHKKTDDQTEPPKQTQNVDSTATLPTASKVGAYALPLLEEGSQFSTRLSALSGRANAVCIALNRPDGTLLYRSSLASKLSMLKYDSNATSLENSLLSIERNGLHTTAVLYIPDTYANDRLMWSVELAMWGAVAAEAIQCGVDDVMLVSRSTDTALLESLKTLADDIRTNAAGAVVGLLLPESVISAQHRESLLDDLSKSFSYLTVDTTLDKENDPLAHLENRISGMQYMIIYYGMRVLLPSGADTQATESYIAKAREYSADSWMIAP